MKAFLKYINNQKNIIMYRLTFLFSLLIAWNASANITNDSNGLKENLGSEQQQLEQVVFNNIENASSTILDVSAIEVIEIEEEVDLGFDTANYLPKNFNALQGKHDLDWRTIEVIEIDEEVELGDETVKYLPKDFNALKGKHDLDWSTIELVEIEEEMEFGFETSNYLPKDFNALKGKDDIDWNTIEVIEIEEDVELEFDTVNYLPVNFNPYVGMEKDLVEVCFN